MSSIAQRQYTFGVGPFKFAHNYLVVYDDHGKVVAELHGLAKDPVSGEFRSFGRSSDAPILQELRKPILGTLRVGVDLSTSVLVDMSLLVLPAGGRLCHR